MVEKPSPAIFLTFFIKYCTYMSMITQTFAVQRQCYTPQLLAIMSNQTFAYLTLAVLLSTVLRFIFNFVLRIIEIL